MRIPLVIALGAAVLYVAPAQQEPPAMRGFAPASAREQWAREAKVRSTPDPKRLRTYMERMASEPHAAGSPGSRAVAEYALALFREWGLEAQIEEFEALLPYPTRRSLTMVSPVRYRAKLQEPALAADPDSSDKQQLPVYNAYSATGDVTGDVVYVNYGIPSDYEQLRAAGVDVKGKIVLARYGRSWRGTKAKVAQEHGAAGCLIYSDPREDGYFQGDVYPAGPYRPPAAAQRGSILDMPIHAGDPLSPGWASEKGARKLPREEAKTIIRIPVLPLSYEDAEPILRQLGGAVVPEAWRGALPVTYHYGPGPARVRLAVDFDWTSKPVLNVIATLRGSTYPDEWVLYGNHHDAWVNGASDPVSGAIVVLETARAMAELAKTGWRPKRTIKFALWDAEEFGLMGSTEWVEKHAEELSRKLVLYLNTDSNSGGRLQAAGASSLQVFFNQVLRDVADPATGKPLLATAAAHPGSSSTRVTEQGPAQETEFRLGALGASSDHVPFYHHLGIASLNLGFSRPSGAGVYHSIYDSVAWYTRFQDSDFRYGTTLAEVMLRAVLRFAEAELLPYEFRGVAGMIASELAQLRVLPGAEGLPFGAIEAELAQLRSAAEAFEARIGNGIWQRLDGNELRRINAVLSRAEGTLAPRHGLPGRPWYRHRLVAPGLYTGYSAKTLPGIRESLEAGRPSEAKPEFEQVAAVIRAYRTSVEEASRLLAQFTAD